VSTRPPAAIKGRSAISSAGLLHGEAPRSVSGEPHPHPVDYGHDPPDRGMDPTGGWAAAGRSTTRR